jgi:hypothetical protein
MTRGSPAEVIEPKPGEPIVLHKVLLDVRAWPQSLLLQVNGEGLNLAQEKTGERVACETRQRRAAPAAPRWHRAGGFASLRLLMPAGFCHTLYLAP